MLHLPAVALLSQAVAVAGAAARDTMLVRYVTPDRSPLEAIFFWASGMTSVLTLLLLVVLLVALVWTLRAALAAGRRVEELFDDLRPMLAKAEDTVESVRKTAQIVQDEVASLTTDVHAGSERVKKTVGELADRVDDFNHLLGKVHSRADSVVTVAGSAIDMIAWGAERLRERKTRRAARKKKVHAPPDRPSLPD